MKPEERARQKIDQLLQAAGWSVQDLKAFNPSAGQGQAVREYPTSAGPAVYVLFVERKPASKKPWTEKLWIYDLRTNQNFTLKQNPLRLEDLEDFIACYHPENRHQRQETERFHAFPYSELSERDKASLDIFWLRDESLEDSDNLPAPEVLAAEIVENLQAALEQFSSIYEALGDTE